MFFVSSLQFLLSIYHLFHFSPTLSMSLLMQSPIAISVFLAFISPPLSVHLLSASFYLPFFYMTRSCRPTPHQFLLRTLLHSNLHSHFIIFLLLALSTPTIILTRLFFIKIDFSCCFSVSAIVSSAFVYAGVTHELSTFHLRLRDMRLSPITQSPFLKVFGLAVILIVTKAINLVDFALGKCQLLS